MHSNLLIGSKAKGRASTGVCVWGGRARSPQADLGLRRVVEVRDSHGFRSGFLAQED